MFGQPNNEDIEVDLEISGDDLFGPTFAAFLFFDHNSTELKPAHKEFLAPKVIAHLKDPKGWAEMYAYTDTTGTDAVNEEFSLGRLLAVQDFLIQNGVPTDKAFDLVNHKHFGEQFAHEHDPDSTEDRDFRVVAIGLWKDIFKVRHPAFWKYKSFEFGRTHDPLLLEV